MAVAHGAPRTGTAVGTGSPGSTYRLVTDKRSACDRRDRAKLAGNRASETDTARETRTAAAANGAIPREGAVIHDERTSIIAVDGAAFSLGGEADGIVARYSLVSRKAAVVNCEHGTWKAEDSAAERVAHPVVRIVVSIVTSDSQIPGQAAI